LEDELDFTGTFIRVEPVGEGTNCQVVILDNGKRHLYSEAMELEFEEAVALAHELKLMMGLPADHAVITREAMIANAKWSLIARKVLKMSDKQRVKRILEP